MGFGDQEKEPIRHFRNAAAKMSSDGVEVVLHKLNLEIELNTAFRKIIGKILKNCSRRKIKEQMIINTFRIPSYTGKVKRDMAKRKIAIASVMISFVVLMPTLSCAQVNWAEDLDSALKTAAREDKFIVLDVSATW